MMNHKNAKRAFNRLISSAFLLTIILMAVISFYVRPMLDDYSYGSLAYQAWKSTHSFFRTMIAALESGRKFYQSWTGDYVCVFLKSIHPGVFGDEFYGIGALIVLSIFLIGTYSLCKTVCLDFLRMNKVSMRFVFMLMAVGQLNFMHSSAQGIYWWNAAIYYTGAYGISLLLFSNLLSMHIHASNHGNVIKNFLIAVVASFLCEGGNLMTALMTICAVIVILIWSIQKKFPKKIAFMEYVVAAITFACFLINVFSPGNANRQAQTAGGMSVIETIANSFLQTFTDICVYSNLRTLACIIPLCIMCGRAVIKGQYHFKNPIFFFIVTLSLYTVQYCPSFYARGFAGESRCLNLTYFSYYWLVLANFIYGIGYLANHFSTIETLYKKMIFWINQHVGRCIACWLLLTGGVC